MCMSWLLLILIVSMHGSTMKLCNVASGWKYVKMNVLKKHGSLNVKFKNLASLFVS